MQDLTPVALLESLTYSSLGDGLLERDARVAQLRHHSGIAMLSGLTVHHHAHPMLGFKT